MPVASELREATLADLRMHGDFLVQEPRGYLEDGRGVEPGAFSFEPWRRIHTDVLVKTRVWPAGHPACDPGGERMCADVFVYDVLTGEKRGAKRIAAVGTQSGRPALYSMDLDGQRVVRMTGGKLLDRTLADPAVSPDGQQVAFTVRSEDEINLYVSDLDGQNVVKLTEGMGENSEPAWSPDGRYLLVRSTRTGRSELWLATVDGAYQTQITHTGGWSAPSWVP